MQVFRCTAQIADVTDFDSFEPILRRHIAEEAHLPLLLVRDDDVRAMISICEGKMMLSVAYFRNEYETSIASTYWLQPIQFQGLRRNHETQPEHFVDASLVLRAVRAFFQRERLTNIIDFQRGVPDREILSFPTPIRIRRSGRRELYSKQVAIPAELQASLRMVSDLLEEIENESTDDLILDAKDAIQFGALSGHRINAIAQTFSFAFNVGDGHIWSFEINHNEVDAIANGDVTEIDVVGIEQWRVG